LRPSDATAVGRPGASLYCPPGVTLLLGGARSGKSDLAVRLALAWGGDVTFVATCEPDGDAELAARVARHRADRPPSWRTVEESTDVLSAVASAPADHLVLVDCVTLWIAKLLVDGLTESEADGRADEMLQAIETRTKPVLLVSNEVGLGVHPSSALGSAFRDVLGRVNRRLADGADQCVFLVAGQVLDLSRLSCVFGREVPRA
jgi:adenosyl cobinamide kinase/adenosyl cobinamide phosphate guanylyltransferase